MKKIIFRSIISLIFIALVSIVYLSTVGIETKKFNHLIVAKVSDIDPNFNLKINKVSVKLIPLSFAIKLKTLGTNLIYNDEAIKLESIKTQVSLRSFFENEFSIENLDISTKSMKIKETISFLRSLKDSPQLFILEKIINIKIFEIIFI